MESTSFLDRTKTAWGSQIGLRVRKIAYWVAIVALFGLVLQRYLPDYRTPDMGTGPQFEYSAIDGSEVSSTDFRGKVVVINLWATWCVPCVVETPGFVDLQAEFDGDVQFIGVSMDRDPSVVPPFAEKHSVNYPLVTGPNRAGPDFQATVLPTTIVLDRTGQVRLRHEGLLLEPALRPILKKLSAEAR